MNFVKRETIFTEISQDGRYVEKVQRIDQPDDLVESSSSTAVKAPPPKNTGTVSGISVDALVEFAPQKKINTEDYEYLKQLEETRRRNEHYRKVELDKELREFKRQKLKLAVEKSKAPVKPSSDGSAPKSVISKATIGMIKIKPKAVASLNKLDT